MLRKLYPWGLRYNVFRWFIIICLEHLPKRRWDQVIMFMFLCALFPFLHALLGIEGHQDRTRPVNDATSEPLNKSPGVALQRNQLLARDIHAPDPVRDIAQPNHTFVSVPQYAFPDPTPPVSYSEMASALPSTVTFEETQQTPEPSAPFWFYEQKKAERMLYDPFYLDFNTSRRDS